METKAPIPLAIIVGIQTPGGGNGGTISAAVLFPKGTTSPGQRPRQGVDRGGVDRLAHALEEFVHTQPAHDIALAERARRTG